MPQDPTKNIYQTLQIWIKKKKKKNTQMQKKEVEY